MAAYRSSTLFSFFFLPFFPGHVDKSRRLHTCSPSLWCFWSHVSMN